MSLSSSGGERRLVALASAREVAVTLLTYVYHATGLHGSVGQICKCAAVRGKASTCSCGCKAACTLPPPLRPTVPRLVQRFCLHGPLRSAPGIYRVWGVWEIAFAPRLTTDTIWLATVSLMFTILHLSPGCRIWWMGFSMRMGVFMFCALIAEVVFKRALAYIIRAAATAASNNWARLQSWRVACLVLLGWRVEEGPAPLQFPQFMVAPVA